MFLLFYVVFFHHLFPYRSQRHQLFFHPYFHVVNEVDVPLRIYVMVTKCDIASLVVMILMSNELYLTQK